MLERLSSQAKYKQGKNMEQTRGGLKLKRKYKWARTRTGYAIFDVELFGPTPKGKKSRSYSVEDLGKLAQVTNEKIGKTGWYPRLKAGHDIEFKNENNRGLGFVAGLKVKNLPDFGPTLVGDFVGINEQNFKLIQDGTFPQRSVETDPGECLLEAVSLLESQHPHFEYPLLILEEEEVKELYTRQKRTLDKFSKYNDEEDKDQFNDENEETKGEEDKDQFNDDNPVLSAVNTLAEKIDKGFEMLAGLLAPKDEFNDEEDKDSFGESETEQLSPSMPDMYGKHTKALERKVKRLEEREALRDFENASSKGLIGNTKENRSAFLEMTERSRDLFIKSLGDREKRKEPSMKPDAPRVTIDRDLDKFAKKDPRVLKAVSRARDKWNKSVDSMNERDRDLFIKGLGTKEEFLNTVAEMEEIEPGWSDRFTGGVN